MIHVEGPDAKCGKASGKTLIEEAANAVYAVYRTLKDAMKNDEGFSDRALMIYILEEIGHRLGALDAANIGPTKIEKSDIDPEDIIDRFFGDLLDKED